jgi:hypothetical protein
MLLISIFFPFLAVINPVQETMTILMIFNIIQKAIVKKMMKGEVKH